MKRNRGIAAFAALVGAIAVWNASPAGAEDPAVVAVATPTASPAPTPTPTATPVPKALQISGFGDIGYTSVSKASSANTGTGPVTNPQGQSITGRVFDTQNNALMFHNFNVQVAYVPQAGFGGKVEYSFGDDSPVIHSYPQSFNYDGNYIDLTQGYGSYTGGPITVIVGKFETLAGAEVIESPSDLNFSRSILFGYAVPFTHTGGRITYAVNGNLNLIAGANQGWDTTKVVPANGDVNYLTYEYGLAWNPSKVFSLTAQGYTGAVEEGLPGYYTGQALLPYLPGDHPVRTLTDFVATYHLNSAFTVILNGDIAQQTRTVGYDKFGNCSFGATALGCNAGTVAWDGAALYLSYTQGLWTLTGRGEYFADNGGFRTGLTRDWEEGTATLQYAPNSNLIFRAEYRFDASNNPYFVTQASSVGAGLPAMNNSGVGLEAILKWP